MLPLRCTHRNCWLGRSRCSGPRGRWHPQTAATLIQLSCGSNPIVNPTARFGLQWDTPRCHTQPLPTDPGQDRWWLAPRTRMRVSVSRALPAGWYSPAVLAHCVGRGRDTVPRQHWLADLENWCVPWQTFVAAWDFCHLLYFVCNQKINSSHFSRDPSADCRRVRPSARPSLSPHCICSTLSPTR